MADKDQLSNPIKGAMGVFVFDVMNKTISQQPFDKNAEIAELNKNHYMLPYLDMEVLKKAANIKDERYKYF